ncbi:MAG: polysaccharide deacetylase family protein, partial [Proteobacteria bacterium]|nr:polysaccharide deacetylase family protein [Pseudomonadota bacterium]
MNLFSHVSRKILDLFLGPVWRIVPASNGSPVIYLTFDDGPDPICTNRILDILLAHGIKATFFVIVNSALRYPELVLRAQSEGHAIGNHSLDHGYKRFFGTKKSVLKWVA